MKRLGIISIIIEGDMDQVHEACQFLGNDDFLNTRIGKNTESLAYYASKHCRFDILTYYNYKPTKDRDIQKLGSHLGGKLERFVKWYDGYKTSGYKKFIEESCEKLNYEHIIIENVISRSANLYNEDLIFYMLENFPNTLPMYRNKLKGRTSERGKSLSTRIGRSYILQKLLFGDEN
jgi:hypothetical protein